MNDKIEKYNTFEYMLRIQSRELKYDTKEMMLKELLAKFKTNKKYVNLKYPLSHSLTTDNFLYGLLLRQNTTHTFVITEDWNCVIGYNELKMLYRWMYKGYPIVFDEEEYYFSDMSYSAKEYLEKVYVRVRIYDKETNINRLLRCFFGQTISLVSNKTNRRR